MTLNEVVQNTERSRKSLLSGSSNPSVAVDRSMQRITKCRSVITSQSLQSNRAFAQPQRVANMPARLFAQAQIEGAALCIIRAGTAHDAVHLGGFIVASNHVH